MMNDEITTHSILRSIMIFDVKCITLLSVDTILTKEGKKQIYA